ncbi:Os08g0486901, partial [Oryza sativa Japonica Group]
VILTPSSLSPLSSLQPPGATGGQGEVRRGRPVTRRRERWGRGSARGAPPAPRSCSSSSPAASVQTPRVDSRKSSRPWRRPSPTRWSSRPVLVKVDGGDEEEEVE